GRALFRLDARALDATRGIGRDRARRRSDPLYLGVLEPDRRAQSASQAAHANGIDHGAGAQNRARRGAGAPQGRSCGRNVTCGTGGTATPALAPRSGERAQDSTNGLVRVRGARKLPLTPTLSPLRGARERTEFAARSSTAVDAAT